eukprot:1144109-Pelagomonas_calceolata.AAC.4
MHPVVEHVSLLCAAVDVLQPLTDAASAQGVSLIMHVKQKSEDGSAELKAIIEAIKAAEDTKVGVHGKA